MARVTVASRSVSWFEYFPYERRLRVGFVPKQYNQQSVYDYLEVPKSLVDDLVSVAKDRDKSFGEFFDQNVKKVYTRQGIDYHRVYY